MKYSVYLDYYNLFDVVEPLETGDAKSGNKLQGSFLNNNDKDSYTVSLAGKTVFKGDSRFSNQAFFILLYDDRKRLIKSSDATFQEVLDPGDYTVSLTVSNAYGQDTAVHSNAITVEAVSPVADFIEYGASPRATICLTVAAKAFAFMNGRGYVTPQDVKSIGMDVLRHRVIVTYEAEAEDLTAEDIVKQIFDGVKVP